MKIFSPDEIKSAKADELAKDILRTQTIKEAKASAEKELDLINAKFQTALAGQRLRWVAEENEYSKKISPLKREVEELETRKRELFPIEYNKERLDNLIKENEEILLKNRKKEEELDLQYEVISSRLDDLHEKEQELKERELEILLKEEAQQRENSLLKENQKIISETLIKINKN